MMKDNNFADRLLRAEKKIEKTGYFRKIIKDFFCLDVMRTITQTTVTAKMNLAEYLLWINLQNATHRLPTTAVKTARCVNGLFVPIFLANCGKKNQK